MGITPQQYRFKLIEHPKTKNLSSFSVAAFIMKPTAQIWKVHFQVTGEISSLKNLSANRIESISSRGKDLWKSTCFEFFLAPFGKDSNQYLEWNFSAFGNWDFYSFKQYREATPLEICQKYYGISRFNVVQNKESLNLEFEIEHTSSLNYPNPRFNLSCILETVLDDKFYFSIIHLNPEKPDFHLF